MTLAPVNVTTVSFQGTDANASSLRRLAQDLQTVERALNQLISIENTANVNPDDNVPPHVLATIEGLDVDHTVSGLTAGQVLKAISAVNAAFQTLKFSELADSDISDNPENGQIIQFVDGFWTAVNAAAVDGVTGGANVGDGPGKVFLSLSGTTMQFRSIQGVGVTVTQDADTITITLPDGTSGPPGVRGLRGRSGDDGERGRRGLKGDKGDKGDRGIRGPHGREGDRGERGRPGRDGVGSGGGLILTDGITTIAGTTKITVSGATVGGSTPNATLTISGGGGSSLFNITPDSHPSTPTGVGLGPNDEFETGATIDTAGARYASATAWTAFGLSTGANAVSGGNLVFKPALTASRNFGGYSQPVAGATFTYTMKAKISAYNASTGAGMFFATASGAAGKILWIGFGSGGFIAQRLTNNTTFSANQSTAGTWSATTNIASPTSQSSSPWVYMRLAYDGTNLTASFSDTGVEGTFFQYYTETAAAFLGGAPALVGFGADNESATVQLAQIIDWFRRTA